MNTPTFQRLYAAELSRTGSPTRAYGRATVLNAFLGTLAQGGSEHRFSRNSFFRHKAALRRAGMAPVESPADLAILGRDLGAANREDLGRLLWALNTSRHSRPEEKRSVARAIEVHAVFIEAALRLMEREARACKDGDAA